MTPLTLHRPSEHARTNMPTVSVRHRVHGDWQVTLPDDLRPVICETLQEAQRIAHLCAEQRSPCELIVQDAYQRIIHREVIIGDDVLDRTASPPQADNDPLAPPTETTTALPLH